MLIGHSVTAADSIATNQSANRRTHAPLACTTRPQTRTPLHRVDSCSPPCACLSPAAAVPRPRLTCLSGTRRQRLPQPLRVSGSAEAGAGVGGDPTAQRVTPDTGWDAGAGTGHASLPRAGDAWPPVEDACGSYRPPTRHPRGAERVGGAEAGYQSQLGTRRKRAGTPTGVAAGSGARPVMGLAWFHGWLPRRWAPPDPLPPAAWQRRSSIGRTCRVHTDWWPSTWGHPTYVGGGAPQAHPPRHPTSQSSSALLDAGSAAPTPPPTDTDSGWAHPFRRMPPADTAFQSGHGRLFCWSIPRRGGQTRSGAGQKIRRRCPPSNEASPPPPLKKDRCWVRRGAVAHRCSCWEGKRMGEALPSRWREEVEPAPARRTQRWASLDRTDRGHADGRGEPRGPHAPYQPGDRATADRRAPLACALERAVDC